jgi:hypothetical protein
MKMETKLTRYRSHLQVSMVTAIKPIGSNTIDVLIVSKGTMLMLHTWKLIFICQEKCRTKYVCGTCDTGLSFSASFITILLRITLFIFQQYTPRYHV